MRFQNASAGALHLLEHAATVTLGFALIILGLGMTFSIVFVLPGIPVLGIGVCLVVGGLFAHVMGRRTRSGMPAPYTTWADDRRSHAH